MKTKTLKITIALIVILLAMMALNTVVVRGVYTGNITNGIMTEEIFNEVVPDEINLDMTKVSLNNLEEQMFDNISQKLKEKGITVQKGEENMPLLYIRLGQKNEDLYIDTVLVSYNDSINGNHFSKEIKINWSNTVEYNQEDKEYVENTLIDFGFKKDNETGHYLCHEDLYGELGEESYYKTLDELINNKELYLILFDENGGVGDYFKHNSSREYQVYKNNVCYAYIEYHADTQSQITVPATIEDTNKAYIEYALPKVTNFLKEYGVATDNLTIENISGYWYKVTGENEQFIGNIILKKQDGAFIGNNIFVNSLPLNTNIIVSVKENKALETEIKNKGYSKILGSYELTLEGVNKLENPIDITFNLGNEYNGKNAYVLHEKTDGSFENFERTVNNGKITITVSELSPFVIGVKEETNQDANVSDETDGKLNDETSKPTQGKGEKDETPKTGISNIIGYVAIIAVIAGTSIIIAKKKLQ